MRWENLFEDKAFLLDDNLILQQPRMVYYRKFPQGFSSFVVYPRHLHYERRTRCEMIKVSCGIIANSGLNFVAALRPKTSVPAFQKKRWWTNRWLFSQASESNRQFEGNSRNTLAQYSPVSHIVGVDRSNIPYKLAASVCVEDVI